MNEKIININLDELNSTLKSARAGDPRNGIAYFIIESNKLIEFILNTAKQIELKTGHSVSLPQ